jgi:hypothetical protein
MFWSHAVNLGVTVIPVHVGEDSAFSLFQVGTDAFWYAAQLFSSAFFCYPNLLVFNPGVEPKMWIPQFHCCYVLLTLFAFAVDEGLLQTYADRSRRARL